MAEYWWQKQDDEMAAALFATIAAIDEEQGYRETSNLSNLRLYSNMAAIGLAGGDYATSSDILTPNRLTLNVVQSIVDTVQAMLSADPVRVKFQTYGGTYKSQKQAKDLTTFVDGQFYQTNLYQIMQPVIKDGSIFGTGFLKIFEEDAQIAIERVFSNEIKVDDIDGRYGTPRSLYQTKEMSKTVLAAKYPKMKLQIQDARGSGTGYRSLISDPVLVNEAWHLPSHPGADDGRHVICTSNVKLYDDPTWDDPFPILPWRWNPRPLGYMGQGIPEQVKGVQIEINYILRKIQQHMTLNAAHLMVPHGAQFNSKQWNNTPLARVDYAGDKPPTIQVVDAISPQYGQMLEALYQKAFELTGVSQLSAQSKKPSGIESAPAFREFNDFQSRRFAHTGLRLQAFYVEAAKQMIRLAKRIDERGDGSYKIMAERGDNLIEMKWSDVAIDEDCYRVKAAPANLMPTTPWGRKQDAVEMMQGGLLTPEEGLELLGDYEDVKAIVMRKTAPRRLIEKIISRIIDDGVFISPEPYMNLQLGLAETQSAYQEYSMLDVPEPKLSMLRDWIDQCKDLIDKAAAAAQAQIAQAQAQAQMPPPASPLAPEAGVPTVSPNVPGAIPPGPLPI